MRLPSRKRDIRLGWEKSSKKTACGCWTASLSDRSLLRSFAVGPFAALTVGLSVGKWSSCLVINTMLRAPCFELRAIIISR